MKCLIYNSIPCHHYVRVFILHRHYTTLLQKEKESEEECKMQGCGMRQCNGKTHLCMNGFNTAQWVVYVSRILMYLGHYTKSL